MISQYLPIDHKDLEEMFHDLIKYDQERPRRILTTVVPETWKPPVEVIKKIKNSLWINDVKY
jgi:hypothetical protein